MFRKIFLNQSSFAALILFLIIFVIDLGTLYNINILSPKLARDFLAVVGLILLLNGIIRWSYNISIYRKIKNILVSILFIFIINFFLSSNSRQPVSLKNLIISTAFSLISIFLLMIIFALIRELIFVQRRKSTNRNFNLLFVLLVCFSFFVKPTQLPSDLKFLPPVTSVMSTWQNIVTLMLTILTIYLIVINSFRIQWIKFVNKKEKIKTLFISLLIIALLVWWHAKGIIVAANYSLIVSSFFYVATIFITIYFSVSALVILLHLPTAGLYDRRVNELSSLHNLSRYVVGVFDIDQVKQIITNQTIEVAGANYSWLVMKNQQTQKFELGASKNLPANMTKIFAANPTNELTDWIKANKMPLMIDRLAKNKLTSTMEICKNRNGSLLGVPLISNEEIIGILFAVKGEEFGFMTDDQALLTMFANNAALAMENANLIKRSLDQEKYEQELKIAHEAQQKLLPNKMPEMDYLQIDAACKTANEVGGDYYDFIYYDKSKLGVIIGDVSGKGAEAAFYMAEVKGVIESFGSIYSSPKELLIKTNKILYNTLDKKTFVSALFGVFDFTKKTLVFCRAGHCPLLYWSSRNKDIYLIEPPGLALGLDGGKHFEKNLKEETIKFSANDIFIFFTDGVSEARNPSHAEFEEQRLCDVIFEVHEKSAATIKNAIIEQIENFVSGHKQHDDLTMVVIKVI